MVVKYTLISWIMDLMQSQREYETARIGNQRIECENELTLFGSDTSYINIKHMECSCHRLAGLALAAGSRKEEVTPTSNVVLDPANTTMEETYDNICYSTATMRTEPVKNGKCTINIKFNQGINNI